MKHFKIGGVPEHFNLPWYLTLKNKEYQEEEINLRWIDYYGGTGQMCKALREKEIDMAVILTEGIIRDIIHGNECKIVQCFVKSPLIWGIHVAKNSNYTSVSDLKGTKAAISRYGSGSHLMAYVNAENEGWDIEKDLDFEPIKNLEGALEGLPKGDGDYFMWEKFTTKPYVDNGTFRLVGECLTPWPCFVIAVRNDALENEKEAVKAIIEIINKTTLEFKNIPSIDKMIANRYNQKIEDVQLWLSLTEWGQENLSSMQVEKVQDTLQHLDLIETKMPASEILYFF
ncbi:ABC transporter substrate-binding protein [Aureisphaera sp. CAU 1614]|uniref:ABC transporter substrate-binding protein n=1 Tax=Halomarinibacterium sedimenti TaxID=2857106 RepID=A0A9X1FQN9_9FLAO|nr:substrate-binding domain-containing protein [Halomarinibacterium sedimenti]MBW2939013.1 ABC transporter substrate-binding protein [Halomarinibacterium sedimenti]